MNYECTEERFLKDVAKHEMSVIRDDGVNRHLRFKNPGSSGYWFDLITWPGTLCIDGDCGTYVFKRTPDMFKFFRTDRTYMTKEGNKLAINPSYWGEKLVSIGKNEKFQEFDEERFDQIIKEYVINWIKEHRDSTSPDERRDLWIALKEEVIDSDTSRKMGNAYDFHHRVNSEKDFYFQDLFEYNCDRYTFHFIWCCYAIAHGIVQYDSQKGKP